MTLEDLGFNEWHKDSIKNLDADQAKLARIVAVDRDLYVIAGPVGTMRAECTGKLLYGAESPEEMPCVGDWGLVDYLDNDSHAVIFDLLPRKTLLRRRAVGGRSSYQPIAANVDVAFIVQSCDVDFNLNRLDRYIVASADGGVTPKLLLTKRDLIAEAALERIIADVKADHAIDVTAISNVTGSGFSEFLDVLQQGLTYCLVGSSGVGKTSLLNRLVGAGEFAVGSVNEKDGKGRHTTTRRQLIALDNGALFIDTPGMREFGMMAFEAGIEESFQDIVAAAKNCRFADCTHTQEEGCAVLAMLEAGRLSREKYDSYMKLQKESEHYEMTYLEKRKKDKAFGKMLKNYHKFQN